MKTLVKIYEEELDKPRTPFFKTEGEYIPKPAFRPSALGTPCLRKLYYSYHRVPQDFEMDTLGKSRCLHGDYIHEMISHIFRKAGVLIDYYKPDGSRLKDFFSGNDDLEFTLKDSNLEMKAKIDGVMIIDNQLWLGEWKSINNNGFSRLSGQAKTDHKIQMAMYIIAFNRALEDGKYDHITELKGFNKAIGIKSLYYNKDKDILEEHSYSALDLVPTFQNTVAKMINVKTYTNDDKIPPTTPDWCKSCSWREKCLTGFKIKTK